MITVLSVNRGSPQTLKISGRSQSTGIFKRPVAGAVSVGALGVEDDAVLDTRHHGGPDQAIYLYRSEDYEFWARQLNRDMDPGTFGENLTIAGLTGELMIGDRLRFPDLELQVSAPRIPCGTLAARMGDKRFATAFVQAERPGAYCRVVTPGTISAGVTGELVPFEDDSIAITTFFRDFHRKLSPDEMRRYLALPIDGRSRAYLQSELGKSA